ncbi:MAG: kelch repeat-containing protein [Mangrovibacterium sp.]
MYSCSVTEGVSLPEAWKRGGHAGGLVDGKIVVAGGNNWSDDKTAKLWLKSCLLYDNCGWKRISDLPEPLAYSAFACDETGIYVAGGTGDGTDESRAVYSLKSLSSGWTSLPSLPKGSYFGAGAILDNWLYVACGVIDGTYSNRMYRLNLSDKTGEWMECQMLPGVPRALTSLVACGDCLYLLGGLAVTNPLTPLQDAWQYNPEEDKWIMLKDLPMKGYAWAGSPIDRNHILLTGCADGTIHDDIWIVDRRNMSIQMAGRLTTPSTTAPLIKIDENHLWFIGGEPDANKNRIGKISVIQFKKQ